MTTNPKSLAYDPEERKLLCEICHTWTFFEDLFVDGQGEKWDVCKKCGLSEGM